VSDRRSDAVDPFSPAPEWRDWLLLLLLVALVLLLVLLLLLAPFSELLVCNQNIKKNRSFFPVFVFLSVLCF
jgi:hypothetical protein